MAERTWIHAFTDGRDVSPHSAARDLAELPPERIATVCGRYYAMDRDSRWERTDRAVCAMLAGEGEARRVDPVEAVRASYDRGVTDEFIEPVVLDGRPRLGPQDTAIFFNFRPDRARQLSQRLLEAGIDLTTMTRYRDDLPCPVAFEEQEVTNTLAEVLAAHGAPAAPRRRDREVRTRDVLLQRRRGARVGGGDAHPRPVTARRSELRPEARDVGGGGRRTHVRRDRERLRFGVVNFANPDMVGHTGSIPAVVAAVEATDRASGGVLQCVQAAGGVCLVTADHGNAEVMLEADGVSPHTAHTTNPVPLVVTDERLSIRDEDGGLSDLAPTILTLLGVPVPLDMTGVAARNDARNCPRSEAFTNTPLYSSRTCRCHSQTSASSARPSGATSVRSRSSSGRTSSRSTTTSCV